MWVGVGRIILDFYNNSSVTKKQREIESLCKDLRKKFNISILEVADFEEPERCVIGFSVTMPENWKIKSAESLLEKILETLDQTAFARVTAEDWELLTHGGDTHPLFHEEVGPDADAKPKSRGSKSDPSPSDIRDRSGKSHSLSGKQAGKKRS